jgi:hypothetical protein
MSAAGSTLGSASPLDASGAAETHRSAIVVPPAITFMAGQRTPNRGAQLIHLLLYLCDALHLEV